MKRRLFYLLIVAVLVGSGSCKKDKDTAPDACATSWGVAAQDEASAMTNASIAYFTSPTVANCNAYKTALQAYINVLKPYSSCSSLTGTSKQDWQEMLNEAQSNLNEQSCE